jgi:hypothetical protein
MEKKASGFSLKTWTRRFFVYSKATRTMQHFKSAGRSKLKGTFIVSSVEVEPSNTQGRQRFTMFGLRKGEARGIIFAKTSSAASLQAWISFMKGLKKAEEKAWRDAAELSVKNLKKLLCDKNVSHDDCDCLQQTELAARLVEHQTKIGKQLVRDSLQLVLTCMVMGCLNAIDETACGSGSRATAQSTRTIPWERHRSRW